MADVIHSFEFLTLIANLGRKITLNANLKFTEIWNNPISHAHLSVRFQRE